MKFKRILLKLSGESLAGQQGFGIDSERLEAYCRQIIEVHKKGVEVGIVIGGGNIYRGLHGQSKGMDRVQGDSMGMMATIINSLALQGEIERQGDKAELLGGVSIDSMVIKFSRRRAKEAFANGKIVIIAGGTGNPYFTTDTASSLRAMEIEADIILKGTRVDGVYTSDPEKDKNAKKYKELSYNEALEKHLKIMDMTAFALCSENNLPIYVFDMNKEGNLMKVCMGEEIGTIIK